MTQQRPLFPDFPLVEPPPQPIPAEAKAIEILRELGRSGFEIPWGDEEVLDDMVIAIARIIREG